MAAKNNNKKVKNNIAEEISLDDLDLDILKEVWITNEEIENFNIENNSKKKKETKKEEIIIEKEIKSKKRKNIDFDDEESVDNDIISDINDNEDDFDFEQEEIFIEPTPEDLEELKDIDIAEDFEDIALALQKEKWLSKLPKDRSEDKRRVWKWLNEFIDVNVPEKMLEW